MHEVQSLNLYGLRQLDQVFITHDFQGSVRAHLIILEVKKEIIQVAFKAKADNDNYVFHIASLAKKLPIEVGKDTNVYYQDGSFTELFDIKKIELKPK